MSLIPKDKVVVATAGKPSGTTATASEMADINISSNGRPRAKPIANTSAQIPELNSANCMPIASIFRYPFSGEQLAAISSALGIAFLTNWGRRELIKFVPGFGTPVSALLTAAATYALGKTLVVYFQSKRNGIALGQRHFQAVYAEQFDAGKLLMQDYIRNRSA